MVDPLRPLIGTPSRLRSIVTLLNHLASAPGRDRIIEGVLGFVRANGGRAACLSYRVDSTLVTIDAGGARVSLDARRSRLVMDAFDTGALAGIEQTTSGDAKATAAAPVARTLAIPLSMGSDVVAVLTTEEASPGVRDVYEDAPFVFGCVALALQHEMQKSAPASRTPRAPAGGVDASTQADRQSARPMTLARQLIDQSNDGILVLDPPSGRVLDSNETARRMLGYTRDEILALAVTDFDVFVSKASTWADHLASVRTTGAMMVESRLRRKDGSAFPVEIGVTRAVEDHREYLIAVVRDTSDRRRADEENRKINRLYRVLSQTNQAIVHTHDLQRLLDDVCRTAVVDGQFSIALVCAVDERGDKALVVASHCAGPDGQALPDGPRAGEAVPVGGMEMRAIRTGRVVVGDDTEGVPGRAAGEGCLSVCRSSAVVPLRVAGRVWGAIGFGSREPGFFDAQELQLTEELAGDIGYAIESVESDARRRQAEAALRQRERHAQSLLRLSRQFERAGTYDDILAAARREVEEIVGYRNLWVYLLTHDRTRAFALAARGTAAGDVMSDAGAATLTIRGDRMLEEIAEARDIVVVDDARTDPRTNKEIVARLGNRTIVNVPIVFLDRHLGSVGTGTFGDEGVRVPTEPEREYLRAMASHMAVSIDRIHLLEARERAEQERAAHLRLLESLDLVNRAIQVAGDIEQMMSDVLDVVLEIFECDRAFLLYPCDPDAASWRVPMERTRPEYPGLHVTGRSIPMGADVASTLGALRQSDGPITFGPGAEHPLPREIADAFGFKSFMGMAIYPKMGAPWQFGVHQCSHERAWTPAEERLFREIGRRLADALTGFLTSRDSQESEGRYRRITEDLTDYRYSVRVESGRAVESTQGDACERVTGYTPAEFAADRGLWLSMVPEIDRQAVCDHVQRILAGENVPPFEHRIVRKDGTLRWVRDTTIPRRDSLGQLASYDGVVRDITERRLAEDSLRKLSRAVEQSPVSIVVTDRSGNIEYVNPKFTEVSGYAPEAVLGRNPRILSSGEMPQDRYREMWRTITSGNEWHGEFHNRKENGELHWEMASISPIFDAEGQITHFVAVKEDITERKRLEEELRQAQKMKAFGQLAGGVAHDFNNVLTVIQGNASLAQGSPPGSHAQAVALEEVIVAVARASDLTRQLLMFSRRQAVQLRDLDLNEVVGRMTRMLTRLIGEHIGLVAHYAPLGAPVHADAGMLEQVLMNLAVNSRDAMPQGGQLDIRTERVELGPDAPHAVSRRRPGSFVRLSVSDSGAGIAPDLVPRIFEPFFTTKDVGQGTGLGLATVFGIVEQHNGWIEVESRVGAGTDFHVYLPRLDGEAPASGRRPEEAGDDLGTETILLVEDEAAVRSLVSHVLTRRGYTVLEAASGPEALAMWTAHRAEIDLLLTDMVMPAGMSGRELAANLRADRPRLKVLFSSGYTDEMLEGDSSLRDGANFIGKPYATAELARKVRACLDAG